MCYIYIDWLVCEVVQIQVRDCDQDQGQSGDPEGYSGREAVLLRRGALVLRVRGVLYVHMCLCPERQRRTDHLSSTELANAKGR